MNSFRDLEVWQKAHQFVLDVYKLSSAFPKDELYGLTSQFRRAAVSIPANICEGYPKLHKADKVRFYEYAQASLNECSYYLILTQDLGYSNTDDLAQALNEVNQMLIMYIKKIKESMK